jgi:hypothetical protein
MEHDKIVRSHLLSLLNGGNAHMTLAEAVQDFPWSKINTVFPNGTYSSWGLLEHIRISQLDILDFIRNPNYKEMDWPKDYWPPKNKKATRKDWQETISRFRRDSDELQKIINDPKVDIYAKVPHGTGQTVLREILLVADHNSYHLGEFAIMRQTMDTWGLKRE